MHQGEELRNFLKNKGLGPSEVAKILGKGDRQSVYGYYKTEVFRADVLLLLKKALGFDPTEDGTVSSVSGLEEITDTHDDFSVARKRKKAVQSHIKVLKNQIDSLERELEGLDKIFGHVGGF